MNQLEDRLRSGLADEAEAWPDPPAAGTTRVAHPESGPRVALMAAAAVVIVVGGITVAGRLGDSGGTLNSASSPASTATTTAILQGITIPVDEIAPALPPSGPFEAIPFTGDGWQLYVAEGANPPLDTYKVCYRFNPTGEATEANGIGPSGCGDWPSDDDRYLIKAVPIIETTSGVALFIDLTDNPVHAVIVTTDDGERHRVEPFRMPDSGKQFAVVELPNRDGGAIIELVDESGAVLDQSTLDSLTPGS